MDINVFAKRLKETRKECNVSARELGEVLGINKATIHRYEKADFQSVKSATLKAIAEYLNVNPDYLIGATDNKHVVNETDTLSQSITDDEKTVYGSFR